MISLQNSQDDDGSFEMDELQELLKDEDFDDKDSGSESSEEVIYQHSPHRLSYKRRRYLQSLPTNSLVRHIVKRWQDEGSQLPFYIFWPWSFIRNFCYGIFLMGWLAVTVAAFWPVFHMLFFPQSCVDGDVSKNRWIDGAILRVDPNEAQNICKEEAELKLLKEYNIRVLHLSSPDWWRGLLSVNNSQSSGITDKIRRTSGACRIHGIKMMMGVFMSNGKELLDDYRKFSEVYQHSDTTVGDPRVNGTGTDVFRLLIAAGISGFYVEDSDQLSSKEIKELMNIFELVQDHSKTDVVFGMNTNSEVRCPPVTISGFSMNQLSFSSAESLSEWIDGKFGNSTRPSTVWNISSGMEDEDSKDNFVFNLRLLQTVLPGIPMLNSADFEGVTTSAGDKANPLKLLLSLRKQSLALQEGEFSLLKQYDHLQRNVFAMLRTFQEEKRYLVLWSFSNSTVSLDFHSLSIEGKWVLRSVMSEYPLVFRMRKIENIQPFEFGVIELP